MGRAQASAKMRGGSTAFYASMSKHFRLQHPQPMQAKAEENRWDRLVCMRRSRCIKVNDCGWHCVFVAVIVAGREGHVLAPRLACFSQRNFLHQKLRSSLSFSTQQLHSSIPYSQPHNCKYGFHRSRLRSRPDSPEQLCQDPQLHRWVSSYPASHFVPPCIFPLHRVALPPFHDENNWSVLMRRLKTPLSEYKTTRLSQL
jgi:hypothetical protein